MKKTILRIFSLILFLLVVCTLLSTKINQEMMTQVEASPINTRGVHEQVTRELPGRMIFSDSTGRHIYEVIDGSGWESGKRIREVDVWSMSGLDIVTTPGYPDSQYVLSASRQPQVGEEIEIFDETILADDTYLLIYPDGVPETLELPISSVADYCQGTNALVADMNRVVIPFMEHRAKSMSATFALAERIYSFADVEQFLTQLPWLAAAACTVVIGLVFWGHGCILSRRSDHGRLLGVDTGIVIASLVLLQWILHRVDLPSSLLPETNIFQLSYYRQNLAAIFTALADLPQEAGILLEAKANALSHCSLVLGCTVIGSALVLLLESALPRMVRNRP